MGVGEGSAENRKGTRAFFQDSPAKEDQLDFKAYAEVLADVICANETQTPLTLGIFGSWGTGKTTLMGLIDEALRERSAPFVPIRFDAWKYDKEDALSRAMLLRVLDALRPSPTDKSEKAKELLTTLDRLAENLYRDIEWKDKGGLTIDWPKLVKWGASGALKMSFSFVPGGSFLTQAVKAARGGNKDKLASGLEDLASAFKREVVQHHQVQLRYIDQFQTEFAKLVKEHFGTRRLIIFIDDLDRCLPEKALDVLEAIKLFLDVEGCVFVLALDSQIVARGIRVKYKDLANELAIDASLYLGKIIQLPFLLPPIDVADMRRYIESFKADWPDPKCIDIFAGGLEPNPRQVKRAVNVFLLLWNLAERRRPKVGPNVTALRLAKIVCLQTAHSRVFEWIKEAPGRLRDIERYCISLDQQHVAGSVIEGIDDTLVQMAMRAGVKALFTLLQEDESGLGRFEKLDLDDLTAFFSLTRSVLPDEQLRSEVKERDSAQLQSQGEEVDTAEGVVGLSLERPASLYQLPTPPADFTGRVAELAELLQAVKQGGVTISGLQGMGGVGKTALALKLAEQLRGEYPDAQLYLDLRGRNQKPLTPREAMAHVIRAYHPTVQLPEKEEEMAALYRSVLDGKRALLLMDNARSADQVRPLIPPSGCLLLVTSRQHFTLPGLVAKNLDKLPPGDAFNLLVRIAPRLAKENPDDVIELARLCGQLPLALRAVGSALQTKKNIRPADYARQLTDTQVRLKVTEIEATLQLSYELLTREVRQKLRFLAVFPTTFDVDAAAAVWESDAKMTQESLSELLGYSFADFDEASRRYRLHQLMILFADQRLNGEERTTAQKRHCGHYLEVLRTADNFYKLGGEAVTKGLAMFDLDWDNIQAGQAWAAEHAKEDDEAAEWCCLYPGYGAYCLDLRQHPRERIRWLEAALSAAQRLKRRDWEGVTLGNLGLAYDSLGEYRRAIECQEQSLEIRRETGERLGEGLALGNLGLAYSSLGEYRRAIEYHEQHLQIAREFGDRLGEANALGNLGIAYENLGEYRRAIELYELHLQIARKIGDRRGEGQALGNLGSAYHALGEYRRAIEYQEQSVQIAREMGDRQGEGLVLWNSALALVKMGNHAEAIARAEAALKILEAIESPHADTVRDHLAKWREHK